MDYAQKIRRCNEYLEGLEEERRKIQVFQRELPLCLELVTQAIEVCKKEISGGSTTTDYMQVQSEGSEQTSSDHDSPVLEQFIPIKTSSENDDEDEQESHKTKKNIAATTGGGDKKKSDWLRSVQLWNNNNESPDPPSKEDVGKTGTAVEIKKNGGAFQPFHREKGTVEKSVGKGNVSATSTSTTESESRGRADDNGNANKKEEKESGQSQRKQRRCWSSELHRRFLHALQQLGGSHVATPKQIRELMEVDGLTNDEVKSHLQKYRLHSRRPSPSLHNNGIPQAPQFVVVGGIWVPPQEYASMTAAASVETAGVSPSPKNGIYAPVATLAQPSVRRSQRSELEERGSHSEGRVHSNSPSTSSSTHTTTDNSHVF